MTHVLRMQLGIAASVALWVAAIVAGSAWLNAYAARPGAVGTVAREWPSELASLRDASRFTLVVALHPECSCSRATLAELERLAARVGARVALRVLLARAEDLAIETDSDLLRDLSRLPHAHRIEDSGGRYAERFGALTSGHVLLYDATGALRFSGGLTVARGHEGDSAGARAVRSIVLERSAERGEALVFGCALETPSVETGV